MHHIGEVGLRHVRGYVAARRLAGVGVRTLQNDLAHLRGLLALAGKNQLLDEAGMTNTALGAAGGSRIGAKTAISEADYASLREAIDDDGLRAMVALERTLGLRAMEAIRSRDRLAIWEQQLSEGQAAIEVVIGTKGGRPRLTHLPDPARALVAVREALAVMRVRGHLAPGASLRAAMAWYRNAMHRLDVQGHALRYAFARERIEAYRADGIALREALARTSLDLGHGDGRGRWVKMVYLR